MVSTPSTTFNVSDPSIAAALGKAELLLAQASTTGLGQLMPFGAYWFWSRLVPAGEAPPRLFEWTEARVADLTTPDRQSLHVIQAGTWHQIEGVFEYWLRSDADHAWVQVPAQGQSQYVLIAGGQAGVNRRHSIQWRCHECAAALCNELPLKHDGTPGGFLQAQQAAVEAFNAAMEGRSCGQCGAVHPLARGFQAIIAQAGDAETAARAFGEMKVRLARWNEPAVTLGELTEGQPLVVEIGARQIALVRQGREVLGIGASCPHYRGPLALGTVRRGEIVCPWHHFRFDLRAGRSATNPAMCAPTYDVTVRGEDVIVIQQREGGGA